MESLLWEEKLVYSKAHSNQCASLCGSVGEWLKPGDCKSPSSGYESSNLSGPTKVFRSYSISVSIPHCHCGETGSIPVGTAKYCTVRLSVRTPAFHAGKRSSILLQCTKFQFRSSKHGVGGGLLILEAWFDSTDRSQSIAGWNIGSSLVS